MTKTCKSTRKNKKKRYCCFMFEESINGNPHLGIPPLIVYDQKARVYSIVPCKDPKHYWRLHYCPFCGKPLPSNLTEAYNKAIINPFTGKVFDPLPKEFESDRWWKKRKL